MSWKTDNVFVLNMDETANINNWQISMTFENDKVTIQWGEATGLSPVTINGRLKQ